MGWALPGHTLEVVDNDGQPLPPGIIAVQAPDSAFFLRNWNKLKATAAKFRGD